ncbi:MAG: hypothetical protein GXO27_00610 [Chlorobi bacterium]|nr:hypothetical protein [Chlorobiota bacterium]
MKKLAAIAGIITVFTLSACGSYQDCRGTYADHSQKPAVEQKDVRS